MRLKKLEISGFKSFAKKVELSFDKGITAIIGPNGSGKSNIADAVRWVLGEQSAKSLRGNKMEDVIFNGTEERRAQAYCEVELTLENQDGALQLPYQEVSVTRRVYRSGESEYLINKQGCRLKDIVDLFRDTGVGKEGYSIIGQGRVDDILSNRPDDRRAVFEEASGVNKFRARKEEAERKLAGTDDNILRVSDIIQELEAQLGPLERQRDEARAYLKMRDELKALELASFVQQYERGMERKKQLGETLAQFEAEGAVLHAREEAMLAEHKTLDAQLRNLDAHISQLQQQLLAESNRVEKLTGEQKLLAERAENHARERERLQEEIRQLNDRGGQIALMQSDGLSGGEERDAAISAHEKLLEDKQAEIVRLTDEVQALEQSLETQKSSMMDALNRLSDAKSQVSRLEAMRGALQERKGKLESETLAAQEKLDSLRLERQEAAEACETVGMEHRELLEHLQRDEAAIEKARASKAALEERSQALHRELGAQRSRLQVLEDMKNDHEGYYASVRNLLRDAKKYPLSQGLVGVVAELMQVPKKLETAVEMVLGPSLQHIVTKTEQDAQRLIQHLREKRYGRATFLPISAVKARTLSSQERATLSAEGCLGVASELISCDAAYAGVINNLLGRTVIVENLDAGIALMKRNNYAFRIATLQGDIINPGGAMTGGSVQKSEFSILGRERSILDISEKIAEMEGRVPGLEAEAAARCKETQELEDGAELTKKQIHTAEISLTKLTEKLGIIDQYVEAQQAQMEKLRLESSQIDDNINDIDEETASFNTLQTSLQQGHQYSQNDIVSAQDALQEVRKKREAAMEQSTALRLELTAWQKEKSAYEADMRRMRNEQAQILEGVRAKEQALDDHGGVASAIKAEQADNEAALAEARQSLDEQMIGAQDVEKERQQCAEALRALETRREEEAEGLRELQERRHRMELQFSRVEMELETMHTRIWEEYELTYEGALAYRQPISLAGAQTRMDELRAEMRELGDVNIAAIEDYQQVSERFQMLTLQREDLQKAREDLTRLIEELLVTMEARFREQFDKINENFGLVFPELFGGGKAELLFADESNILESDIQILVQPPGKRRQLLSLLSGGERALTAIALLFAMLRLKPTPFCVLDEIEASLDEANVELFARYLRGYVQNTQFILITHRKGSMTASDTLYGVAMEEKGVSRLVSVRLSQAG